jgi:hypothetical protein
MNMGRVAFADWSEPRTEFAAITPVEEVPARFSALEWSVIALAANSGLSSLREPGRIAAALGGLFARSRRNDPDPRLEALRRIAILAWRRGWSVPSSELRAFVTSGFSLEQYELLQNSVGRARMRATRRRSWAA